MKTTNSMNSKKPSMKIMITIRESQRRIMMRINNTRRPSRKRRKYLSSPARAW
jgi:hypothetical protein